MAKKTTTKSNAKRYEQQWDVPSDSDPSAYYTVSLTQEQQLICSCWPFLKSRQPCKHIKRVQRGEIAPRGQPQAVSPAATASGAVVTATEPKIIKAKVRQVTPIMDPAGMEVVSVKVPTALPPGNDHFLLTVLADLLGNGVSLATLREHFPVPRDLTAGWITNYVQEYGRLIFDASFAGFEYIMPQSQ